MRSSYASISQVQSDMMLKSLSSSSETASLGVREARPTVGFLKDDVSSFARLCLKKMQHFINAKGLSLRKNFSRGFRRVD